MGEKLTKAQKFALNYVQTNGPGTLPLTKAGRTPAASSHVTMKLTEEEAQMIARQREQRASRRWICEGVFLAADYLKSLGDQCGGGAGEETNAETGKPYGEAYYRMAEVLRRRASYLSANPQEINV